MDALESGHLNRTSILARSLIRFWYGVAVLDKMSPTPPHLPINLAKFHYRSVLDVLKSQFRNAKFVTFWIGCPKGLSASISVRGGTPWYHSEPRLRHLCTRGMLSWQTELVCTKIDLKRGFKEETLLRTTNHVEIVFPLVVSRVLD